MPLACQPFTDMTGPLTLVDQVSVFNPDTPIDVRDVRVEMGGGVAARGGSALLQTAAPAAQIESMFYARSGSRVLLQEGTHLNAISLAGAAGPSGTLVGGDPLTYAPIGLPGSELVWAANGTSIVKWDGSAFTVNPASVPKPEVVAVTPWDFRLMYIGFRAPTGWFTTLGSPHTVGFSLEGDPTNVAANQREVLHPGDGERLVAAVAWRDRVFVFKQTKFWVFFGTTDTGGGVPQLDYYAVQAQAGVEGPKAVCAGRDGVYFVNRNGVYHTAGEEPTLISQGLDLLFRGELPTYFSGEVADPTRMDEASITFVDERLHVGVPTQDGGFASVVYDPRVQWWGYDTLPIVCGTPIVRGGDDCLAFAAPDGGRARFHKEGVVGDLGADVLAHWRSGWHDLGSPDVKRLRMSRLVGHGTVGMSYAADNQGLQFGGTARMAGLPDLWRDGTDGGDVWGDGTDSSDLWGGGRQFSEDWVRRVPVRGRRYSWQFAGLGSWSVQQCDHHVSVPRGPAVDLTANAST